MLIKEGCGGGFWGPNDLAEGVRARQGDLRAQDLSQGLEWARGLSLKKSLPGHIDQGDGQRRAGAAQAL